MLGQRRTRHPSLYDFVFSSCRRRLHPQNMPEQAEGADRTESCATPSLSACKTKALPMSMDLSLSHRRGRPVGDLFSNTMNQEQGNTKKVKWLMPFVLRNIFSLGI
jgi:hypothetical protein